MARKRTQPSSFEELVGSLQKLFKGRLIPPLEGWVYRFSIYLPLLSKAGHEVFVPSQRRMLARLFHDCFEGYSETAAEGNPPWYGSWFPKGAAEPEIDRHTVIVIYSPQTDAATEFFGKLRWIRQRTHVAQQQVVLIEKATVELVRAVPML